MSAEEIREQLRDAAEQIVDEQRARDQKVIDLVFAQPGSRGSRPGEVIHLDRSTSIVQVLMRPSVAWAVVHDGQRPSRWQADLDNALLYAVQLRNLGRPQDTDYVCAARVLNVEEEF